MERKQQSNETLSAERTQNERVEEPRTRRPRLQIDLLEERVAPSAIWGD